MCVVFRCSLWKIVNDYFKSDKNIQNKINSWAKDFLPVVTVCIVDMKNPEYYASMFCIVLLLAVHCSASRCSLTSNHLKLFFTNSIKHLFCSFSFLYYMLNFKTKHLRSIFYEGCVPTVPLCVFVWLGLMLRAFVHCNQSKHIKA